MLNKFSTKFKQAGFQKKIALWIVSTVFLFCGFYTNLWSVAEQKWFDNHQKDTESHVVGRMVKSRQDGIFSSGGLNGWGTAKKTDAEWIPPTERTPQFSAYLHNLSFENFSTYNSQPGGQGMIFSLLDRFIPFSQHFKLNFFYIITSILSAIAFTFIINWIYEEFGMVTAMFVLVSAILSHWLTVFGKNLWWSLWAFYLPMIAVLYYLKNNIDTTKHQISKVGLLIFIVVSIKCFINGFEYITTTLIMMITPCIYYGILDKWNRNQWLKWTFATAIGTGVAILFSMMMLCVQIGAVKGGFVKGIEHVIWSFEKRTYGEAEDFPPIYAASLEAGPIKVVITYLNGVFFDLNNYISIKDGFIAKNIFKIRYYYLIVLFMASSLLLVLNSKNAIVNRWQQTSALFWMTWFSILAPLSWFVIFKAHSYIHTHMSFLLWQMPFTLLGFAVLGVVVKTMFIENRQTELEEK